MDGSQGLEEEWEKMNGNMGEGMAEGFQIVEVMTDGQVEELRRQIVACAVISENLLATYRTIASRHLSRHGTMAESLSSNPSKTSGGHKPSNGKRRTTTPTQKQILKDIYGSGKRYPSKEEVRRITFELSRHGEITESSVYNWFQNRRKREKRKIADELGDNSNSEVEPKAESRNRENIKLEKIEFDDRFLSADDPSLSDQRSSL